MDLAGLIENAKDKGFTLNFAVKGKALECSEENCRFDVDDLRLVDSTSVDFGTDPGDEATLYLIEAKSGQKGFLVLPYASEADPDKTAFIDALIQARH
ncbi:hypothetical protein ACSHT0_02780 [Tepidicaulis sp. LMO-SS28]|uniref:hypothetical protein n=1 Tax=Tepidicaulis sp. LMO-SS28 TaxID=3447455 RepID=UPI003EE07017